MMGGKPNPLFKGSFPPAGEPGANQRLRDRGLLPIKWQGTITRFRELGIPITEDAEAFVKTSTRPGAMPGGVGSSWGPRWAVLVAEADPCNEDARDAMLRRAVADPEVKAALETIAVLADNGLARQKMADYVMELWNPDE